MANIFHLRLFNRNLSVIKIYDLGCLTSSLFSNYGTKVAPHQEIMIFNLFYTSSANDLQQNELQMMLEKAREKNAVNGITGILLYCDGIFVQLLEGEETKVKETFDRIAKDPRHKDLRNVVSASSEKRYFPEWKMGYKPMSPEDLALIEKHENLDIKTYFKSSQPYKFIRLLSRSHWQL